MQGQSPYLINTGLFYQNESGTISAGILYNRIGKRLIGVGRNVGTVSGEDSANIPDSYEMPRNTIDLSYTMKVKKNWEIKAAVRDVLAEKVSFKQFVKLSGNEVEQITKEYKPGCNISLSIGYNF